MCMVRMVRIASTCAPLNTWQALMLEDPVETSRDMCRLVSRPALHAMRLEAARALFDISDAGVADKVAEAAGGTAMAAGGAALAGGAAASTVGASASAAGGNAMGASAAGGDAVGASAAGGDAVGASAAAAGAFPFLNASSDWRLTEHAQLLGAARVAAITPLPEGPPSIVLVDR